METISASDIELLVFGGECACENSHAEDTCSIVVTHRTLSTCDGDSAIVCRNAAVRHIEWSQSGELCFDCKRSISKCWTITPI